MSDIQTESVPVVVPSAGDARVRRVGLDMPAVVRDALSGVASVAKRADSYRVNLRAVRVEYGTVVNPETGQRDILGWSFTATDTYMLGHVVILDDGARDRPAGCDYLSASVPVGSVPKLGTSSRGSVRLDLDMVRGDSESADVVGVSGVARFRIGDTVSECATDYSAFPRFDTLWPASSDPTGWDGVHQATAYGHGIGSAFFGMFATAGKNRGTDPVRARCVQTRKPSVWVMESDSDTCRVWGLIMPVRVPE